MESAKCLTPRFLKSVSLKFCFFQGERGGDKNLSTGKTCHAGNELCARSILTSDVMFTLSANASAITCISVFSNSYEPKFIDSI